MINLREVRSGHHPNDYYLGWGFGDDYMSSDRNDRGWRTGIRFKTWPPFFREWKTNDVDLNRVVDYQFTPDWELWEDEMNDNPSFPHVQLTLWVAHPRKGATRGVLIEKVTPEDLPTIREFLAIHKKANERVWELV